MKTEKKDMGRENALGFQHHDRTDAPGKRGGGGVVGGISAKLPSTWTDYGHGTMCDGNWMDQIREETPNLEYP